VKHYHGNKSIHQKVSQVNQANLCMIEQREVDAKCKCKGVSKKGSAMFEKVFRCFPQVLSKDLKHANKVLR
jgi:hypothetical protein